MIERWHRILTASVFLILIVHTPINVSAQTTSNGITATTNKLAYKAGEKVIISGTVEKIIEGKPVTILVRNPIQNVYNVGQVDLLGNVFIHDLVISSTSKPGVYTVEIKHGTQSAKLQFIVSTGLVQTIPIGTSAIKVIGDKMGLIKYKNVQVSTQESSITLELDVTTVSNSPIMQEFEIPKEVVDASSQSLTVEVEGVVLNCSETETTTVRILNCLIPPYATVMKITGTSVIPEFGPIAVAILMIGMIVTMLYVRIKPRKSYY